MVWQGSIFARGKKLYLKLKTATGWRQVATGLEVGQEAKAEQLLRATKVQLEAGAELGSTVRAYAVGWIKRRQAQGVASWDDDQSRLDTWVLPRLGDMEIAEVRPRHVLEVVQAVRAAARAPRTVRNVYGVMRALFRDAQIDDLCPTSPCILTGYHVGTVRDARPEWRAGAIYTREELEALISDARVPPDRRVLYGLLGLGALRHGEAAALRWRHLVADEPLGRLVVAHSNERATTKTNRERWMPVHRVLAAQLAEWRLQGWGAQQGRAPGPDDLIVPHAQPTNRGPRVGFGTMRSDHDSWKRLQLDLATLGLRPRRVHDLRRTAITLYREAGAEKDLLRLLTHGPSGDVLDAYTTWGWPRLCAQVAPLQIRRFGAVLVQGTPK